MASSGHFGWDYNKLGSTNKMDDDDDDDDDDADDAADDDDDDDDDDDGHDCQSVVLFGHYYQVWNASALC